MEMESVPGILRERLVNHATARLLHLLDTAHREREEDVIAASVERFERRLVQEIAGVRVELAHVGAALRDEIRQVDGAIRQEMSAGRVELLKWCFLFWIGQVVAVGTLMSVMLRLTR